MKKILQASLLLVIIFCTLTLRAQTPTVNISYLGDADTIAIQRMPNQPVIKIQININGNTSLGLEKLVIKPLCEDSTDIDSVAIYSTKKIGRFSFADVNYPTDGITLVTKRKKFNKDSIVFNISAYSLDTCYLWVVFDLSKTSKGGRYISAYMRADGITISGATYPASTVMPLKNIIIRQKYFSENFEKANNDADVHCPLGTPYGWQIRFFDSYNVKWGLWKGGFGDPDNLGQGNPSFAKSGARNARFYREGTSFNRISMLYPTKPIDLTLATKPLLTFYHAQMTWDGQTDTLGIFYQLLPDTTWKYLRGYDYPTPDDRWVKREIVLPDAMAGKNVRLGFKGYAHWGWGVCVDSITIFETQSSNREIKAIDVTHPLTSFVPQSSKDNPILRANIRIKGNDDVLTLYSLKVTSGNTRDADVDTVKLYSTVDSIFDKQVLLGKGIFGSGTITFSTLGRKLDSGDNYFWVTYDVASNAIPDNVLDASITINSIGTSAGTYPSTDASPTGNRIVKQTIFWDDFETDKGWGLRGDFQRGAPKGYGGNGGFPDPLKAYAGTMIIGDDLTGDGNYDPNLTNATADTATSPLIPCKYFKNTEFSFFRWLNVFNADSASIDIKYEGESNWKSIWNNNNMLAIIEGSWRPGDSIKNSKQLFDRKNFRIRFRLGPTKTTNYSGWNIDNVFFTGDSVKWDAAVTQYLSPTSACGLTANEKFKVRVKNTGPKTLTNIPIKLSIDGGKSWIVSETIPGPLAKDNSMDYQFSTGVNLSNAKIYNVIAKVAFSLDNYPDNDSVTYNLVSVPTYSAPYQQGFEKDTSFWSSYGVQNSWSRIEAPGNGNYIRYASEGKYFWKTDMSGQHFAYENSYLESPCFNFTGDSIPIINFKYSSKSSFRIDGAKLEYSIDGGTSWTYVPKDTYSYPWSWYNDTIHAFHGVKGWTGQTEYLASQIWVEGRQILPTSIANKTNVKFRFNFKADSINGTTTDDGFAIDDVKLMNAPFDVGVTDIVNFVADANYCQYEKDGIVQVSVKNFGIRNMHVNDTIIIGVKVDNTAAVIDTFKLTSALDKNATRVFTMKHPVNIINVGTHKIKAYTLIEKDPYFYSSTNNDLDSVSFTVNQNPVTNLKKSYSTARLDTLVLKPASPAGFGYSWEHNSSTATTQTYLASDIGTYHLTVTNPGTGCQTKDTINVFALQLDAGVSQIVSPVTACDLGTAFKPIVKISNYGTDTLAIGKPIPVKLRLNSGSLISDQITLTKAVAPDSSITVTLNTTLNLSVAGAYQLMVRTDLSPYDVDVSNDSTKVSFSIYGMPTVELGPNVYSKTLSYTLPAPLGYSSYLWNDNSTNDTLIVTKTGKYVLTVTNANGCFAKDSVDVMLSIHDLSIKRVISPVTFCSKPGLSTISCKVINSGTDTVKTSENPVMSYHLNGGALVTQNLVLSSNLLPGDSVTFTFTQKEDIHLPSTNTFLIKATVGNDLVRVNDSITNIVKVYPNPVISLGDVNQSYNNKESYLLSPGSGYASYIWQDGSSNPDYLITQTHFSKDYLYSVIVTDAFGCMGGDTVLVSLTIKDIRIDSIYLPDETCATSLPLKVKVTNSGNVALNENVPYAYFVNGVQHNGAFHFTADTSSNSQDFTLNDPLDFSTIGSKKIKVELSMQGEVRKSNDTLTHVILAKKGVNIDFGTANDTLKVDLPYTLDPGSGSNYSYVWSTSAITQTITVSTNNLYTVTVTNGICTDSKSVRVIDNIYDFAISNFNVPGSTANSICKSAQKQTATFDIQNNGSVNFSNEPITIKYKLNSGAETSKTINFSGGNLVKNTYPLDDLDLSQVRIDTIRLNLEYAKDKVSSNDSIKQSLLNILEIPTINFVGAINDSIKSATSPITLDPGSGYSYNWYDGSTKQTISTSIQRWHWVTVSNGACAVKDSVYVTFTTPVQTISKQATLITYPNPVQDVLYIDLSVKTNEEIILEFISSLGTIVKTDKLSGSMQYAKTIDVSNLPKGLYYLKLYRKDWVMIEKVVIR